MHDPDYGYWLWAACMESVATAYAQWWMQQMQRGARPSRLLNLLAYERAIGLPGF